MVVNSATRLVTIISFCRTLMCTEECLLHASRNPHLGREGVEKVLKEYLGLEKIIWFWRGIMGDDGVVNGHVDNFCCFVRPGVVLLAWTEDKDDPQVLIFPCVDCTINFFFSDWV